MQVSDLHRSSKYNCSPVLMMVFSQGFCELSLFYGTFFFPLISSDLCEWDRLLFHCVVENQGPFFSVSVSFHID